MPSSSSSSDSDSDNEFEWIQTIHKDVFEPIPYLTCTFFFPDHSFLQKRIKPPFSFPIPIPQKDKDENDYYLSDMALFHVDIQKHQLPAIVGTNQLNMAFSPITTQFDLNSLHSLSPFAEFNELILILKIKEVIVPIIKKNEHRARTKKRVSFATAPHQTRRVYN